MSHGTPPLTSGGRGGIAVLFPEHPLAGQKAAPSLGQAWALPLTLLLLLYLLLTSLSSHVPGSIGPDLLEIQGLVSLQPHPGRHIGSAPLWGKEGPLFPLPAHFPRHVWVKVQAIW